MEMEVEGVQGPACADIAGIATELLGAPTREENTREFYARAQTVPQVRNRNKS
ncbi:MAG: hypothetical protein NVSMB56_19530 [Pyrinomonadaceae bacterium]